MRDMVRRGKQNELDRIRSGIDNVFADAFFRNWPIGSQEGFPPVDLYATDGSLVALVSLPGVDIKDVEVSTTVDSLTISGHVSAVSEGEALWQERMSGKFYRSFNLPVPIKSDKVDAEFKAGVLRIVMPKTDELRSRTVQIKEN